MELSGLKPNTPLHLEGIILRSYPFGESDAIYRILTPTHGKISAIAKGVKRSKRRFASPPEPFDCGRMELVKGRGELPLLQGFVPTRTFRAIRESLNLFQAACILSESFDAMLQEHSTEHASELYHTALDGLELMSTAPQNGEAVFVPATRTLRKLIRITGFLEEEQNELESPREQQSEREGWLSMIRQVEQIIERPLKSTL